MLGRKDSAQGPKRKRVILEPPIRLTRRVRFPKYRAVRYK